MNFRLLRIVVWIGIYLLIVETGLEIRGYYRGFDTLLFGSYRRAESRTTMSEPSSDVSMESHDSDTRLVESSAGTTRLWVASSSHAEDSYLSTDVIFPSILNGLFRRSGVRTSIINASHAGMEIEDNRMELEARGPTVKPHFVILYQMSTSITGLSKRLLSGASHKSTRREAIKVEQGKKAKPLDWTIRLVEHSAIFAQLKGNITSRLATKRLLSDSLGPQGDAEFESMVRGIIATTRKVGAVPILCTFASSHIRGDLPSVPDSVTTLIFKYNIYLSLEGWIGTIEHFNEILRRIAAEEKLTLIDLEHEISGHHEYFRDYVHFTPEGHAAVARVIHQALLASVTRGQDQKMVMQ